ncbi:MAG TPA: CoA-transferase [Gemmataceae bacterium]|nr:CoA-transferase [Gemmataceae bacterium]
MNPLSQGTGVPFTDPSANHARQYFASKPRGLTRKLTTVAEAVAHLVADGAYLAIGGFGCARVPISVVHEILRQGKQDLGFAGHTATHDFQILCAGNLMGRGKTLARVEIAYVVGLEARGLSPHARRVLESGEVSCTEWTNYALAVRLKAAAMGLPFLPARSMLGTDTFRRSAACEILCPFTGERLVALPALYPDVAAIHVHEADAYGNCRIQGITVADLDLARAAKKLIITCERLIPNDEIRRDPSRTVIPYFCVDAVCEVPYGSYPGNMPYEYFSDEDHLRRWLEVEKDPDAFREFLDHYIYGARDFMEYLQRCGGLERLRELRRQEFLLEAVTEKDQPSYTRKTAPSS